MAILTGGMLSFSSDYIRALWENYVMSPPQPPMPPAISAKSIVSADSIPDVGAQILEQERAWQASNQGFMDALAMQIDTNESIIGRTNWLLVGAAVVGVFVGSKLLFGRR